MDWLQTLLDSSTTPTLTAFLLGLLTAVSPCPLATNIAAIGFISKDIKNRQRIFRNGLLYTLGRVIAYTVLPLNSVNCIVSKIEFLEMQSEVQNVFVSDDMARYIVSLISATRKHPLLSRGASPRATLSLTDMAKAVAFAEGRDYIVPRDVQNIFICTVNHRIILNAKASASKKNSEEILHEILRKAPKPRT